MPGAASGGSAAPRLELDVRWSSQPGSGSVAPALTRMASNGSLTNSLPSPSTTVTFDQRRRLFLALPAS
jgi:hypothetical protein